MSDKLNSFLLPKSIAIIGASNTPEKIGNILIKKLKDFKGEIIPINPKEDKILNYKTYKSILDYPNKIDLAVIATQKKTIQKIIKEIIKKEIKNLIIISSGFSETGDKKSETELIKIIQKNKINLLGPNCMGIFNSENNLDLTFSKTQSKKGDTVFLSQSGALGSFIMDLGIPLRSFISLGNMGDLTFNDFIEYFNQDKDTKKIVLYIEKIKDGKKFIDICRKSKKQIIAIKSGKTQIGQKSTLSHTGSLSTSIDIYRGAFKQAKIEYKNSLSEAFNFEKQNILSYLSGKKIAIITNAGGAGALLTDELIENNFEVYGPIDLLGTASPNDYARTIHRLKENYDHILVILTPQTMSDPTNTAKLLAKSIWREKIIAIFLGKNSMQESENIFKENNIPFLSQSI